MVKNAVEEAIRNGLFVLNLANACLKRVKKVIHCFAHIPAIGVNDKKIVILFEENINQQLCCKIYRNKAINEFICSRNA